MAQARYQLIVDFTETATDYTDPSPSRDSGQILVANVDEFSERKLQVLNGTPFTMNDIPLKGGVNGLMLLAIRSDRALLISKGDAAAERWALAPNGWFFIQVNSEVHDIVLRNDSGQTANVLVMIGGT